MKLLLVTKNEAGQRLDKMLGKYLNMAGKNFIYKMLRKKNITVNNKKCDGSEKLSEGDEIKLFLSDETIEKFSQVQLQKVRDTKLDIIYEDSHILIVNKPAGMLSQKAREQDESLVEYIIDYLLKSGQLDLEAMRSFRPSVCNRLDRNTSGLVAAGKSLAGLQIMAEVFKDRSLHKYYQCIVSGILEERQVMKGFLTKDTAANLVTVRTQMTEGSLPIVTEYEPLCHSKNYTFLKVTLITGRSHQIRAHLAAIGHPIVGDEKYGDFAVNETVRNTYRISSQLLHSYQLEFPPLPEPLSYLSGRSYTARLPRAFERIMKGEGLWVPGIHVG